MGNHRHQFQWTKILSAVLPQVHPQRLRLTGPLQLKRLV